MLTDLCRFYPAYTIERAADELDAQQVRLMLRRAYERPWTYVVMVEPKR